MELWSDSGYSLVGSQQKGILDMEGHVDRQELENAIIRTANQQGGHVMTTVKRTPLARQTEIIHVGLTVTTWGDAHYGYLHLLGTTGEEGSAIVVDITFTTAKVQGEENSSIEIIAKAVARVMEANHGY